MRYLNNNGWREYFTRSRIIVLVLVFVLFSIFIVLKTIEKTISDGTVPTGRYTDPYSGETVTNEAGTTLESYGSSSGEPILLGISKLLDYGVTGDQFTIFKSQLKKYAQINTYYEVTIDVDAIQSFPKADDSDTNSFIFPIMTNRSDKHTAQLDTTGIFSARLRVFDPDKKLEFDSTTLDTAPIDAD